MGAWHRENPEKVGDCGDPWMDDPRYRKAMEQGIPPRGMPSYGQLERLSTHRCRVEDCGRVQADGDECMVCGGELGENDY